MPLLPAPVQLTHPEKDALICALTARLALADAHIAAQDARIAALEARLNELTRPPRPLGLRHGSPAAQKPPRRRPDATSEPGSNHRQTADNLPEMRGGVSRRVADPAAGL